MAEQEQVERLLKQLQQAPPSACFQRIDENTAGIRAILNYLQETSETVTAGKISDKLGVSTARVAVLLKKMVARGLIEKAHDPADARIVVVKLSAHGAKTAEKLRDNVYALVGAMIDKVGMERMLEFAAISKEIRAVIQEPDIAL